MKCFGCIFRNTALVSILIAGVMVTSSSPLHADETRLFGLIVSEPSSRAYTKVAQPIPGARVIFTSDAGIVTAITDSTGFYEAVLGDGTGVDEKPDDGLRLYQNYPNPFNPSTVIPFEVSSSTDVSLTVYNVLGQTVRILADGDHMAGRHTYTWDGRDDAGQPVSAGVYLYRLTAGRAVKTGKMTLLDGGDASGHSSGVFFKRPVQAAKVTAEPQRWIMSIEEEGFVAWADTFIVYDGLTEKRQDVIMRITGKLSDLHAESVGCLVQGSWGDETGAESDPRPTFTCDFFEDGRYKSSTLQEEGFFIQVPWSHPTVDSVYVTITQSSIPERVNSTIPIVIHFWGPLVPIITNMDYLSAGLLDMEIAALIYLVVGK